MIKHNNSPEVIPNNVDQNDGSYHQKKLKIQSFFNHKEQQNKKSHLSHPCLEKYQRPNWHQSNENIRDLIKLANQLLVDFEGERIYGLGQSPAWIVKALELLIDKRGGSKSIGYIPFSGRFMEKEVKRRFDNNFSEIFCHVKKGPCFPNNQAINNYRHVLEQLGMDPISIIQAFKDKHQKTVLLEYIQSAESLASFMIILYEWAIELDKLEQLKECFVVCALAQDFNKLQLIHLPKVSLYMRRIQVKDTLIIPLADGKDTGPQSDRLVPKYSVQDWCNPMHEMINHDFIQGLVEKVKCEVDHFAVDDIVAKKQS